MITQRRPDVEVRMAIPQNKIIIHSGVTYIQSLAHAYNLVNNEQCSLLQFLPPSL